MSRKGEKEPYFTSIYASQQTPSGHGTEHYYSSIHTRGEQAPPPYYASQSQAIHVNPSYTPPSSLGRGSRYQIGSEPAPVDRAPANRQRCCLIATVVCLVIIIVGAGIGLGLYFGVFSKSDKDKATTAEPAKGTGITSSPVTTARPGPTTLPGSNDSTTTTSKPVTGTGPTSASPTPKPTIAAAYEVTLTLDQPYIPALDDPTSATYLLYKLDIENLMDDILRHSELGGIFIESIVTGFSEGSILAYVRPTFSATSVQIANQEFDLDATLITTVVKTGLRRDSATVQALVILADRTVVELSGLGDKDLGEDCTSANDCADKPTQCTGWPTPQCSCEAGHFERGGRCYSKIDINQPGCSEDPHCATPEAICSGSQCVCGEHRFFDGYRCLKRYTVGTQCFGEYQCASNLTCTNHTCQCPAGSIQDGSTCIPEPVGCDDSTKFQLAADNCGVNLYTSEIQSYTCRFFVEKVRCIMTDLNSNRPVFQECNPNDIRSKIGQYVPSEKTSCREWRVELVYNYKECDENGEVPRDVVNNVTNNQLPVLMSNYEYEFKEASCRYDEGYKFESQLWSSESHASILQTLQGIIFNRNEIFPQGAVYVDEKFEGVDYCIDLRTLKHLATNCIRDEPYWFADWEICNPVHSLVRGCLINKLQEGPSWGCQDEKVINMSPLFDDNEETERFVSEARTSLENAGFPMTYEQSQWLDAISRFSLANCTLGRIEEYPCQDSEKMENFYNDCKERFFTSDLNIDDGLENIGLTPENCRDMFEVMYCVADEFRKLRVYDTCNAEQSVYQKLRTDFDPTRTLPGIYKDLQFCKAYQPVCSSVFILDARYRCPWPQGYHYEAVNCNTDYEKKAAVDFVTCVRLLALSKNQEDCTPLKIKEIIGKDYFRLHVINKTADIEDCLPDNYISTILPTRESVCTSGVPIMLYQDKCALVQSSMNGQNFSSTQTSGGTCVTTARDIGEKGRVDLGCRFYLAQMNCIQVILSNISFSCSMEDLTNSPLPPHSLLYNPNYTQPCLHIYNNDEYQLCEGQLLKTDDAFSCAGHLFGTPFVTSGDREHACMAFQEALGCYDALARKAGINCELQWLHEFLTATFTLYQYANRPVGVCHITPDTSMFDSCPAQLPQGNLCTDAERLTVLTLGACGSVRNIYAAYYQNISTSEDFDQDILTCRQFQYMIWCSANVTKQSGSECTQGQIKNAMVTRSDLVTTTLPGFNIGVCQDSCYNTEDAAKKCVIPYMFTGSYQMKLCRTLSYMWHCMDARLRRADGGPCGPPLIKSAIGVNIIFNNELRASLDTCPALEENRLDLCESLADITGLGGSECYSYIYNMSKGDCRSGDEARKCYRNLISTLGQTCTDIDTLVESALVLAGKGSGMDITSCIGSSYTKEGFCPFTYNHYCSAKDLDIDICVLDSACEGAQKCCFSNCKTTCKPSLENPARWYGEILIKNETFVDDMKIKGSAAYNTFLEKYSNMIDVVIGQFYHNEIDGLSRGIILSFHVWSTIDPYHQMFTALETNFPYQKSITMGTVRRDEEPRPGDCPSDWNSNDEYCSSETCEEFDIECSQPTAKCCWMSCGSQYGKRCIDQGISKDYGYDCKDILERGFGSADGIYKIKIKGSDEIVNVYCDMTTQGGGWTVFQKRSDNSVDFYRNFSDYENGFGSLERNFWLGLKYVYNLTNDLKNDLRLDMENAGGEWIYELDWGFRLENPPYYTFQIDGYNISGGVWKPYGLNIGLGYYNGHPFSTFDEERSGYNCAQRAYSHGAFWYSACSDVNPNGVYIDPGTVWNDNGQYGGYNRGYGGIIYYQWMGFESLKSTKMMIRRT